MVDGSRSWGDGRNGGALLGNRSSWGGGEEKKPLRRTEAGGARGRKLDGKTGERGSRAPARWWEAVEVAGWLGYGLAYSIPRVPNKPTIYIVMFSNNRRNIIF